jgi:hypothetical protein
MAELLRATADAMAAKETAARFEGEVWMRYRVARKAISADLVAARRAPGGSTAH